MQMVKISTWNNNRLLVGANIGMSVISNEDVELDVVSNEQQIKIQLEEFTAQL